MDAAMFVEQLGAANQEILDRLAPADARWALLDGGIQPVLRNQTIANVRRAQAHARERGR